MMKNNNSRKLKILLVIYGDIHFGGVSVLLNNLLKNMDKERFDFTLYAFGNIVDEPVLKAYKDNGVDVIVGRKERYDKWLIALDLLSIILRKRIDIVHCNTGGLQLTSTTVAVAKICGVKKIIAHSHAKKNTPTPYNDYELRCRDRIKRLANVKLTCSKEAAEHMFGNESALLISNGIDINKFSFNPAIRAKMRDELHLHNELVIGTVGRLEVIKNQTFIIDIAKQLNNKKDVFVLIVGSGSQKENLISYSKSVGLDAKVVLVEANSNVECYLNAMDIFVMPSKAEGLGIAAIEAQAMDLPVWCSTSVPQQATVTDKIHFLSLDESAEVWAEDILQNISKSNLDDRMSRALDVAEKGYDIVSSAKLLHDIYLE
ncbi:glycosyltransferase [Butyrivibrio sp. YAB3001]|uniref:glycosyltransferase n=1 Tax=Butyrivibrio sp. YAB3001 TaxID=1520812 RepID=UPI0008F647FF|nr:glycosyltransferase [Butyrivibrio sp. YAB3001]SFC62263.1 Glycosyltransferase involved in cell wall bisynthesis [Butyrivibrio sp. YAB3001]